MSDYDNTREDDYERKLEASNEARDAAIEFHADNWLTAVTQSVEKSNGTFDDVTDYRTKATDRGFSKRKAESVDVFIEELHNLDFMERAAQILIGIQANNQNPQAEVSKLFQDMATNYADYQFERSSHE